MAQTVAVGIGGLFSHTIATAGYRINEHVCRLIFDINDSSGFDAWEKSEFGQGHIEWGANGIITYGTAVDKPFADGSAGTVTLTYATGCTIAFSAKIGTQELMLSVRDNGRVRLTGRGNGTPTFVWAVA